GINWNGAEAIITAYVAHEIRLEIAPNQGGGGDGMQFIRATVENTVESAVGVTTTSVTASASNAVNSSANSGAVRNTGIGTQVVKSPTDVRTLAEANRGVNINDQENPSRTVVNLFDLTAAVNFDWAWFTGRTIQLTYVNTAGEARSVFILHAFFDIEYVPTEVVWSDKVTAVVIGHDQVSSPELLITHLLTTRAGAAASDLDAVSFAAIKARYTAMGYRIDGLIDAGFTVREALASICRQCHSRLFPSGGKLKMALREGHPVTKPVVRQLDASDLQLRSIAAARQPLADISNRVQLFYQRDWTADASDASGYLQSVTKEDAKSIARFGLKTRADAYCFDLVRSSTMAAAVADFYIKTTAWPSTFYTFMAYLSQFDLEKEDVLGVTANFNFMAKVPMVVRAMDRIFGSGKNGQINLFRIVAENLYYLLTKVTLADQVLILESLSFMMTEIGEFADHAQILDELLILLNLNKEETVLLTDTVELLMDWRPELLALVTATAQVLGAMDCRQEDTVEVSDVPWVWSTYGFGSGGFGTQKFGGGRIEWQQKSPDQVYAFLQLLVEMAALRQDTVLVSDSLTIGGGFGGHLSSGLGLSAFGL
ncbi:MAG: hypothetical protein KJ846_02810, partial [Proteobacteria bacterium]|nr:hypothetical protein [Pseudomonadota bacterium]